MRSFFCLLGLLLVAGNLSAQTLTGVVYDRAIRRPVPGVAVYLDGTTGYSITDSHGKYTLIIPQRINTPLVFRHLSYETYIGSGLPSLLPDTVFMTEKVTGMEEIVVRPSPFTREQMLEAFRKNFLGTSRAGTQCRISNEHDLRLYYNAETRTLHAEAGVPLDILNPYLGYRIAYDLADFRVSYSQLSLYDSHISNLVFLGTSSYTDLASGNKRIERRRWEAFQNSTKQFFGLLSRNELGDSDYRIRSGTDPIPGKNDSPMYRSVADMAALGFSVADSSSFRVLHTRSEPLPGRPPQGFEGASLYARLGIVHRMDTPDQSYSDIWFLADSFTVDYFGNIAPVPKLIVSGAMAEKRIGEMLPLDYMPEIY